MTKSNVLYEGKAKILYETNVANELIQFFKDDATANNAQKLEIINFLLLKKTTHWVAFFCMVVIYNLQHTAIDKCWWKIAH